MRKTISVNKLLPGMFLDELGTSWLDHPFWRNSFLIADEKEIQQIRDANIQEVTIDTRRGSDLAETQGQDDKAEPAPDDSLTSSSRFRPVSLEDEMKQAARLKRQAANAVKETLEQARMGQAIKSEDLSHLVEEISDSIIRQPSAMLGLVRIKHSDEYTYMHSVAVCALMIALARQLGLEEDEVKQAGMSGLMHDVGKAFVPNEILNKPARLSDEEFRIIQTHPEKGYQALVDSGEKSRIVLDVVRHHHEKINGDGYPRGLPDSSISLFARMGSVCDVYDAVTSDRPYKRGWDPADALSRMAHWTGGQLDKKVFQAFVKTIGIYPTGSLVRLSSGRLAVVLDQNADNLLKPRVKVFYSTNAGTRLQPKVVDLSRPGASERIECKEDPAEWDFKDLESLWAQ
ncbi:HD-GYP domain-containing protein [Gammaproteobacteria bacterium AB-CW1]|uniref:HD-GYP domain-containing protein n=1 Tax=Natronospira elongata TaxID=3110268 RepID=A0AAP6MMW0_9GAMM|nr:HD-GYP domain-containing protein [Gammaproteobacteria bacterium AB-CW1]